ncbi:MAG: hypothetical protein ACYC1U_06440 [Candidatus Aquicultorales bacterium]
MNGAVVTAHLSEYSVTASRISEGAVTGAKINPDAAGAGLSYDKRTLRIAKAGVTASMIDWSTVRITGDLVDWERFEIPAANIASGTLDPARLPAQLVTEGRQVADGVITGDHIMDGSIKAEDLEAGLTGSLPKTATGIAVLSVEEGIGKYKTASIDFSAAGFREPPIVMAAFGRISDPGTILANLFVDPAIVRVASAEVGFRLLMTGGIGSTVEVRWVAFGR